MDLPGNRSFSIIGNTIITIFKGPAQYGEFPKPRKRAHGDIKIHQQIQIKITSYRP